MLWATHINLATHGSLNLTRPLKTQNLTVNNQTTDKIKIHLKIGNKDIELKMLKVHNPYNVTKISKRLDEAAVQINQLCLYVILSNLAVP